MKNMIILLTLLASACVGEHFGGGDLPACDEALISAVDETFCPLVIDYVRQQKGWQDDQYKIELRSVEKSIRKYLVIHKDEFDLSKVYSLGNDKSFIVLVDEETGAVVDVLHFQ